MLESIGMGPEAVDVRGPDLLQGQSGAITHPALPWRVGGDGHNRQRGEYLLVECRVASMSVASLQQA